MRRESEKKVSRDKQEPPPKPKGLDKRFGNRNQRRSEKDVLRRAMAGLLDDDEDIVDTK